MANPTITINATGITVSGPLIAGEPVAVTASGLSLPEGAALTLALSSRAPNALLASCVLAESEETPGTWTGTLETASRQMAVYFATAAADDTRPAVLELVETTTRDSLALLVTSIRNSALIPSSSPCAVAPVYLPIPGPPGPQVDPSDSAPLMDGAASAGTSDNYSRGDHQHPTDTSRMAATATGVDIIVQPTGQWGGAPIATFAAIITERVNAKQDTITDLATIRSGAAAGATAVQPAALSDYRTATAQDAIDGAQDTAIAAKYTKPATGIPESDLAPGVIPTVPSASDADPLMDGAASPGVSPDFARADHTHPTDTTRASVADLNPALAAASATDAASTAALADRTITSVDIAASVGSLALSFPAPVPGRARDFSARLLCRGSGLSTISLPSGETVDFGAGEIANVCNTPGISLVQFAEIAAGRWSISASVPPEPVAVDWVDFTGTQYVDTGLAPGNNELDFEIVLRNLATGGTAGLFGCREDTAGGIYVPSNYSAFVRDNNNGVIRADIANNGSAVFLPLRKSQDYTITWSAASRTIVAALSHSSSPGTATAATKSSNALSFVLGGINTAGKITAGAEMRLYSATFSRAGTTLLDLSPVRIGSSGFLLDSISGSLYGSGDLVPGPDTNA